MTYTKKLAIAGAALFAWLAVPSAASANHCPSGQTYPADCVHGLEVTRQPLEAPAVLGTEEVSASESASESESSDTLPVTGGDLLGLTVIGLGAVGAGTVFVRRSRRTT